MRAWSPALLVGLALTAGMALGLAGQDPNKAVELYRSGRYAEAYQALQTLIVQRGPLPVLLYDAGDALYRLGRYEEAAASFRGALGSSAVKLRESSYYNTGNAYLKAAQTETDRYGALLRALSAYEQALLLDPDDRDAKWNLELTLRLLALEEAARSPGPTHRAGWGTGNLTKSGYGGQQVASTQTGGGAGAGRGQAAPSLTEAEARQLLRASRQEQLRRHGNQTAENPARVTAARDW